DRAQPYAGQQHQQEVDVAQARKEQRGHQGGRDDDEPAHGGGALFFHLAFQPKVAYGLPHLHALEQPHDALAEPQRDHQREDQGHAGAEADVVEHTASREVERKALYQVVQHYFRISSSVSRSTSTSSKWWRTP